MEPSHLYQQHHKTADSMNPNGYSYRVEER